MANKKRSGGNGHPRRAPGPMRAIDEVPDQPEQEQQEIARAAKREGISMSSFVATASLAEARRTNQKR